MQESTNYIMRSMSRPFLCWIASVLFILSSCQPELDPMNPAVPDFDSTQLIKSIEAFFNDVSTGNSDSVTENFSYDTINRKITATWSTPSDFYLKGLKSEYSYSSDLLLTGVTYTYPPTYSTLPNDPTNVSIEYDADKVPRKITMAFVVDPPFIMDFTKTTTPGGYQLSWKKKHDTFDWTYQHKYFYNSNNKLKGLEEHQFFYDQNGNQTDSILRYFDSLVYTPGGNLQKVYRTFNNIPGPAIKVLYYEFGNRYTKGDQLSKLREGLFRGVENIPFDLSQVFQWYINNITLATYDSYAANQFIGFPCQTSMHDFNGSSEYNVDHEATFDHLDRLIHYSGYTYGRPGGEVAWKLTYYK